MGKNLTIRAPRRYKLAVAIVGALSIGALATPEADDGVLFQSLESKTVENAPVFNRIKFFPGWQRDIWMMNQSHHGADAPAGRWDRLAIVIDKKGKTARFYQLPPGKLEWDESLPGQAIPYRVSCFICHPNGPRAVRPDSAGLSLSPFTKWKVSWWNLRVRMYGRIHEAPEQAIADAQLRVPFRHRAPLDNDELHVKACAKCHNENARGPLTRQNALTIQFMLEKDLMPPSGRRLSEKDRRSLEAFIAGL